ncbi:delta-like protein A [Saccostrea echinata]|uniref:delta-like protein A n=1 Tax=Saccostrea echinata TaxID=191078 RepID=UPI002A7EB696|nr:delta-like protein A [Saccostrea echinata]
MHFILGLYLIIILNFSLVLGGGHLSVKLVEFVNPGGKGSNNRKCDGRFGITFSKCDHRFIICVDKHTGANSMNKCPFGRIETPVILNADTISFPDNIHGMENPFLFNVTSWPASGKFKLKVDIWDDDSRTADDHVAFLYRKFVLKPSGHRRNHTRLRFMLHRRTRLVVDLAVFCDDYYFGKSCDVYCRPRNDYTGHYICNSEGQKICIKGWRGSKCTLVDDCVDVPCQNNGTCLTDNRQNSFFCECQHGFSGKLCDIQLCQENVCKNGGVCYLVNNTNACDCPSEWTGERCETRLASCDDVTCFNNGTCAEVMNKFQCRCKTGWQGIACLRDIDECLDNPCHGNSKCINTDGSYFCKCLHGWSGNDCAEDVNECEKRPCANTAECVNTEGSYRCRCLEKSTVKDCFPPIRECSHMVCQNNGTCIVDGDGERCLCLEPWRGEVCSELKDYSLACKNDCTTYGDCKVDTQGNWTCTCQMENLCNTSVPKICAMQKGFDVNISYPRSKTGKELIKQDFFLCMGINITQSKVLDSANPNKEKMNIVGAGSKFVFWTNCSMWLQNSLKNCSQFLFDDDLFQEENSKKANKTRTGHLMNAKGSENWFPLFILLVVPLLLIACFLVLRKRMKKTRESEEPDIVGDNTNISFGNFLYAEINGDNH